MTSTSPAVDSTPYHTSPAFAGTRRVIQYVSVVLPCLNEEAGVTKSVNDAIEGLARAGFRGEVIVVDNGSTDDSVGLATAAGARVVHEHRRGTGAATLAGLRAASGDVIVTADADGTYDLENLGSLLEPLQQGADLVVGSRLQGNIAHGSMPVLHRYLGTPLFNVMLRMLTGADISDSQSGFRAFWREPILALELRTPGFESVTELLLRASRAGMRIVDVPSDYRRRMGESKLSTLSDGWKHLRMLLILSPHITLVYPGIAALAFGLLLSVSSFVFPNGVTVGPFQVGSIFLGPLLLIIGAQAASLGAIAAHRSELTPGGVRKRLDFMKNPNVVDSLLTWAAAIALVGLLLDFGLFLLWLSGHASDRMMGPAGFAQACVVVGVGGVVTVFAAEFSRESL